MISLDCMLGICLTELLGNDLGKGILGLSAIAVIISGYKIHTEKEMKNKLNWIYIAIFGILLPFVYVAVTMVCHIGFFGCTERTMMYSIPISFIVTLVIGYILIPFAYMKLKKNHKIVSDYQTDFIESLASKNKIKKPPLYVFESSNPEAFSYSLFTPVIMISTRLYELLNKKELEAVLLHELGHLKNGSSYYKFAAFFAASLPVFSRIIDVVLVEKKEESIADDFAVSIQKTNKHIKSARKKVHQYYKLKEEI